MIFGVVESYVLTVSVISRFIKILIWINVGSKRDEVREEEYVGLGAWYVKILMIIIKKWWNNLIIRLGRTYETSIAQGWNVNKIISFIIYSKSVLSNFIKLI